MGTRRKEQGPGRDDSPASPPRRRPRRLESRSRRFRLRGGDRRPPPTRPGIAAVSAAPSPSRPPPPHPPGSATPPRAAPSAGPSQPLTRPALAAGHRDRRAQLDPGPDRRGDRRRAALAAAVGRRINARRIEPGRDAAAHRETQAEADPHAGIERHAEAVPDGSPHAEAVTDRKAAEADAPAATARREEGPPAMPAGRRRAAWPQQGPDRRPAVRQGQGQRRRQWQGRIERRRDHRPAARAVGRAGRRPTGRPAHCAAGGPRGRLRSRPGAHPLSCPAAGARVRDRDGPGHDPPDEVHPRRGPDPARLVQHRRRPAGRPAALPPPGDPRADRAGRPRAALPDGADHPGGQPGPRDRDPGSRPRGVHALPAEPALSGPPPGEGARYAGPHLLQVRGRQPGRQPQAEHRARPGVLQQGGGRRPARDRDRRRPVGQRAGVRRRLLRARGQGLHGPGELRPEAVPPDPHGDLRGRGRRQPLTDDELRPEGPRGDARQPGLARASRSARRSRTPRPATGRSTRWARCWTTSCSTRR